MAQQPAPIRVPVQVTGIRTAPTPTYEISKEFAFSAAHSLRGLPDEHQCSRLHGHNYVVVVRISADSLDPRGFVIDYGDLGFVKEFIDSQWDHQNLNAVEPFMYGEVNPSAENMARVMGHYVAGTLARNGVRDDIIVDVSVSETPKTWAHWRSAR